MKLLPSRPRLPGLSTFVPRATDPAIFWFNSERDDVIRTVTERVLAVHSTTSERLEIALNEVAWHESRRLARQKDQEAHDDLGQWNSLLRRVGRMNDREMKLALERIVRRMVTDVAGNFDPRVYRLAQNLVPRLLTGVMSPGSLTTDWRKPHGRLKALVQTEGNVEHLRRLASRGTLIFVPTHLSNLDSLVLGYALEQHGLPPVVYGAGKNLFTNPIISFFMHNLGAYRVDRRVKAPLYKLVLKTYSSVLIERGYHSLFFPGGTRSRSGMIEHKLKLGLAGTGIEAFARARVRGVDRAVYFVPVTINYALVLEAETLIDDHLKEQGQARYIIDDDEFSRLDRWVSFFRKLTKMESPCVLRFGRPLDPFGNDVDEGGQTLAPDGRALDPSTYVMREGAAVLDSDRDRAYTQGLGDVLVDRYRQETVLLTTHLVAHVLYRHLVSANPNMDDFIRCRHRDTIIPREAITREIADAQNRIARLREEGKVRTGPHLERQGSPDILAQVLDAFRGYHTRRVIGERGADLIIEEPSLLLYYQNRLVPFAMDIAGESQLAAAREIHRTGGIR